MRSWTTHIISDLDRPLVDVDHDDEGVPTMRIRISDAVTIMGDATDVARWIREAALQVVQLDEAAT